MGYRAPAPSKPRSRGLPHPLALPARDAIRSSSQVLRPYQVSPQVQQALDWLEPQPSSGSVLGIGWWNWDAYLIPQSSGRAVVDGWYDEGTVDWRPIREIRHMMWFATPHIPRLHEILTQRDGRYVVVAHDAPLEFPDKFLAALKQHPQLFRQVASWDNVTAFERVEGMDVRFPTHGLMSGGAANEDVP